MQAGAYALLDMDRDTIICVASLYQGLEMRRIQGERILHYLIPTGDNDLKLDSRKQEYYKQIIHDFVPDLVHIHGSEYPHSLAAALACGNTPFVVSIQGLVSRFSYYYYEGGIRECVIKEIGSIRDILRLDRVEDQLRKMTKREEYEKKLIHLTNHVIGRTTWDKSCVWAINPKTQYHFCNETLRQAFYKTQWDYETCEKHSIFLSQAHYPLKGAHQLLEALPLVLRHFPDTQVYIAGHDFLRKKWFLRNGYANYLLKLIHKNHIEEHVHFIGLLNENEMADRYARSHVFVSPSSIENSPNSVGEAQLVGTPVIGSYVGGTMDMITDGETGFLYRFEEIPLLAMRICQLFASPELCQRLSINERKVASNRHDGKVNAQQLLKIYKDILRC
jgi:glycosyltransferase involved in cell wall biosynthesis